MFKVLFYLNTCLSDTVAIKSLASKVEADAGSLSRQVHSSAAATAWGALCLHRNSCSTGLPQDHFFLQVRISPRGS